MFLAPDLWPTLRAILRKPAFFLSSASLLAAGIAAATITFTFVDALLLRPLAAPDPSRLYRLVTIRPQLGPRSYFSERFLQLLQRESKAFPLLSATFDFSTGFTDAGHTERVLASATSASFFTVFGVKPIIGPAFPTDTFRGTPPVLLSYPFWQRRYRGALDIIGRPVSIRGVTFEIAGVLPPGFNGATVESGPDIRIPLPALRTLFPDPSNQPFIAWELVGRLAPGISLPAARAETYRLYANSSDPGDPPVPQEQFALQPLQHGASRLRNQAGTATTFLALGAAVLALMICVNLSGLLLARVLSRRRELAVRSALGASRRSLALAILTEASAIVLSGAVLATLLTLAGVRWVAAHLPPVRLLDNTAVPMALNTTPDWRVLLFATALCFTALALTAAIPAWKASRSHASSLREGSSASRTRGWKVLVALQIALCTALLFAAVAVKSTLANLRNTDAGIARDHVICFTVDRDLSQPLDPPRFARILRDWRSKVQALPGVHRAAISSIRLLRGSGQKMTIAPAGGSVPLSDFMNTSTLAIGPDYFDTMAQSLISGRTFTSSEYEPDPSAKTTPVIVNQAFARRFDNGTPILGRQFGLGAGKIAAPRFVVIGVVTDAKYRSMREPIQPTLYSPISPEASRITLLVRTLTAPAALSQPVQAALRSIEPNLLAEDIATLDQDIEASLWTERALFWVSNAFAAIALTVAAVGLGGLMIFLTTSRTREIALRVAIGATPRHIFRIVLAQAARPVLIGLLTGTAAGILLLRAAQGFLYDVSPSDPYLSTLASASVSLTALLASLLPTSIALRVHPATALRQD